MVIGNSLLQAKEAILFVASVMLGGMEVSFPYRVRFPVRFIHDLNILVRPNCATLNCHLNYIFEPIYPAYVEFASYKCLLTQEYVYQNTIQSHYARTKQIKNPEMSNKVKA